MFVQKVLSGSNSWMDSWSRASKSRRQGRANRCTEEHRVIWRLMIDSVLVPPGHV